MQGITELTKMDFDYAKTLGGTIKLLGVVERNGDKVSAYVSPCYVTNDAPMRLRLCRTISFPPFILDRVPDGIPRPTRVSMISCRWPMETSHHCCSTPHRT